MKQRLRIYFTEAQKAVMWDRWKAGDTLREIGKLFERPYTSIHNILSSTGGIRPPARHRQRLSLSLAEREEISCSLVAGESIRCVARRLKRAASTISRELMRNGDKTCYRATKADEAAWQRAHRPKTCKLACNPALEQIVAGKLQSRCSPEQIAGRLKRTYPGAYLAAQSGYCNTKTTQIPCIPCISAGSRYPDQLVIRSSRSKKALRKRHGAPKGERKSKDSWNTNRSYSTTMSVPILHWI